MSEQAMPAVPDRSAEGQSVSWKYDFTVIMAVYQVEEYLREAVDSLIAQTFPFERVQLILSDDGSSDNGPEICHEYAAKYPNILYLRKENGGQASARNLGLRYAEGKYINFMDPDDKLTPETLSRVYSFFEANVGETDVVSVPMKFFGAQSGDHWQNTKFRAGTRVIDLEKNWRIQQASASSAFFRAEAVSGLRFNEQMTNAEDLRFVLEILIRHPRLGVVKGCSYQYRKRADGSSTVDGMTGKKKWYTDMYRLLVDEVFAEAASLCGEVPKHVQYAILCQLQWRMISDQKARMELLLSPDEQQAYFRESERIFGLFDDEVIMAMSARLSVRAAMLRMRYNAPAELIPQEDGNLIIRWGETDVCLAGDFYTRLEFMQIQNGVLTLEGFTSPFALPENRRIGVAIRCNGTDHACETKIRQDKQMIRMGRVIQEGLGFKASFSLPDGRKPLRLTVLLTVDDAMIEMKHLSCGRFMPVSDWVPVSTVINKHRVRIQGNTVVIDRHTGPLTRFADECRLLAGLLRGQSLGMKKAVPVRLMYHLMRLFERKQIWLFSDRIRRAGDNGEAMFRYVCEHCPKGVKPVFVLHSQSVDLSRLTAAGKVVKYDTVWCKLYYLLASAYISSSGDDTAFNPFDWRVAYYADLMYNKPYVFLQHGVTKDDISRWLNRYNKNISGFVTSGERERQSLRAPAYGYPDEALWLTGMPRYDLLQDRSEKLISIMPTWRQTLMTRYDPQAGEWRLNPQTFVRSDYFLFYDRLIRDERLRKACEQYHYRLQFYPHPNVLQYIHLFHPGEHVTVPDETMPYSEVFSKSALLVTDYSSTFFDFAYLRKPIIYCQFDRESFFGGAHVYTQGYYDYDRDGFGPVTIDLDSTVDAMISMMRNDCVLDETYRARIDAFFAYQDRQNCRRVFEKITQLPGLGKGER